MLRIEHKRGDTFAPSAQYLNADGTVASLLGCTIKSQLRDAGNTLVHDFIVEVTNEALGQFRFLPVDTSNWPLAVMFMDIQYTQGTTKISTETIEIAVIKKVTR